MPILMTARVPGQTPEGYRQMIDAVATAYRAAPGFIAHLSHPIDGGWCVMDVWASKEAFERFYAEHVAPKLPPAARPKIRFQELHDAVTPFDGTATFSSITPFDSDARSAAEVRA